MKNFYTVEVSQIIQARAETVYAILADYREGHPRILPKPYFTGLTVEQGGVGAGTVFTAHMEVYGVKRSYQMTVSEPEPGRVLVERDEVAGVETTFTVEPLADPRHSRVTIYTQARTSPGLLGILEKMTTPAISRKIYREELAILNKVAQQQIAV